MATAQHHRDRTTGRPARFSARNVLRLAALLVVAAFATVFVVDNWASIASGLSLLTPSSVGLALLAVGVGLVAAMLSWRAVLTGLGSRLPVLAAARVYFLGQLGKYVPGGVWPVLAQAELSRRYGVPASRAGFAALTQMLIGLITGVVAAGTCLALAGAQDVQGYVWLLPIAVLGAIALIPAVFNRLLRTALRLARRPGEPQSVTGRSLLVSAAWCLVMWLAFGAHLWALAENLSTTTTGTLALVSIGAYALAWVVGFVIIFLPAGAGAREAALVLALSGWVDRDGALALALVSRFLMLVGDVVTASLAAAATRRSPENGRDRLALEGVRRGDDESS